MVQHDQCSAQLKWYWSPALANRDYKCHIFTRRKTRANGFKSSWAVVQAESSSPRFEYSGCPWVRYESVIEKPGVRSFLSLLMSNLVKDWGVHRIWWMRHLQLHYLGQSKAAQGYGLSWQSNTQHSRTSSSDLHSSSSAFQGKLLCPAADVFDRSADEFWVFYHCATGPLLHPHVL